MKRITLTLAALTFAASTALAYVQPGHLALTPPPQTAKGPVYLSGGQGAVPGSGIVNTNPGPGANRPVSNGDAPDGATNPVPEPATLLLASMGFIALAAARRRRRA